MQADNQPQRDQELVARAREGDPDAFGELVRRHRARAVGVARTLTQDTHLAEDIVQEALVKAFLKLGSLVDERRFAPWLSRIVRNEAYMKLRRGGPHGKERPFTAWAGSAARGTVPARASDAAAVRSARGEAEQRTIDDVLFRLGQSALESARQATDPTQALLRKELVDGIRSLLRCLTRREKDVFERFFLDQLPPQDIAALLHTSVASIYNSLSRARTKMQHERIRVHVSMYIEQRRALGKPKRKLLAPPGIRIAWKGDE
ncbi:sigma-70 family RNA polymerase sigma factor [Paenibacillus lycopersici]|uniref:RNA polymerase sigma factor n=1 Tax=Paenibacillus lycopersici TaxID=2704462 RepID=A0A6C0FV04_9BACL|nr:sigma-70 family RNA polymerase sigma factor [Paenibacillus lycopersici]QHT58769.1 sigma-70 family RNA polymerase sigma factor [Paenibacillus lycopersici]